MSDHAKDLRDTLDFAVDLAWRAGRLALSYFQMSPQVERKSDASPVTAADRAAERLLRETISRAYPDDGILGEEFGEERPSASRRWVLDPIDGTRSFVRGVPLWGVLIALESAVADRTPEPRGPTDRDRESVLGVIHFPALGETVYAANGVGCWWDGRRARVSDVADIDRALVITSDVVRTTEHGRPGAWDRLRAQAGMARTWGDCYGYALLATGRAEAMLDPVLNIWDAAPMATIVREAGGVLTDWDGEPSYTSGSLVATNAALAEEVRALLAGPAARQ